MSKSREDSLPPTPVRRGVNLLVPELKFVGIDEGQISTLAAELATEDFVLPRWQAPVFPSTDTNGTTPENIINFLFIGNAINFQFRNYETGDKFIANYEGTEWEGAFAMWACLKREYDENPAILHGETLANLSFSDVERLFDSANEDSIPMLDERYRILTQVGERLVDRYDGRFTHLVETSEPRVYRDGDGIVDRLISEFPSFRDNGMVRLEDGTALEVPFWKRAQLAVAMAYGRFKNRDTFQIKDPAAFTLFVDYNLPNILRYLGVLKYSDDLARLIDSQTMINAASRKEVELRAAAVYAADELIKQLTLRREEPVYIPQLDCKLFRMRDNIETPIHITRTTAY